MINYRNKEGGEDTNNIRNEKGVLSIETVDCIARSKEYTVNNVMVLYLKICVLINKGTQYTGDNIHSKLLSQQET